ncbi:MAG: Maf family protein [Myxococcota bacterium]|nr:Maf family protein [Myxococcota bacterium]
MLVLASSSPRRQKLLSDAGLRFEIVAPDIPETLRPGEAPREMVERLSLEKARHVAAGLSAGPRRLVLGSDTAVVVDEDVLGKPRDAEHALEMLSRLSGRGHRVLTGVAVIETDNGRERVLSVESQVLMRRSDTPTLRAYVATGESMDKAGAYALQGEGRRFVDRVEGSETNVIGLPMDETLALLDELGLRR